jgi:hypothetical protein
MHEPRHVVSFHLCTVVGAHRRIDRASDTVARMSIKWVGVMQMRPLIRATYNPVSTMKGIQLEANIHLS